MAETVLDETVAESQAGAIAAWDALIRFRNAWIYPGGTRHYVPADFAQSHVYDVTKFAPAGTLVNGPIPNGSSATPSTAGSVDWQPYIDLAVAQIVADGFPESVLLFPEAAGSYVKSGKIRLAQGCRLEAHAPIIQADNSLVSGAFYSYTVAPGSGISAPGTRTGFARRGAGMVECYDEQAWHTVVRDCMLFGNAKNQLGHENGTAMTLHAAITKTSEAAFVVDGMPAGLTAPFRLRIGQEVIQIVAVGAVISGGRSCTPQATATEAGGTGWASIPSGRGFDWSTAASHAAGEAALLVFDNLYIGNEGAPFNTNSPIVDVLHLVESNILAHAPGQALTFEGQCPSGTPSQPNQSMHGPRAFNNQIFKCRGIGFLDDSSDGHFVGNHIGSTGREGCIANGGNSRFDNTNKFYFSGQEDPRHGDGILVDAGRQTVDCEVQDNWRHGVVFNTAQNCGELKADSNGHGKAWAVLTGITTNGTTALVASAAMFDQTMVGMNIWNHADLPTDVTIASVTDSTHATLSAAATGSHAGISVTIGVFGYGVVFDGAIDNNVTVLAVDRHPVNNGLGGTEASQMAALDFRNFPLRNKIRLVSRGNSLAVVHGDPTGNEISAGAQDGIRSWGTGTGTTGTGDNGGGAGLTFDPMAGGINTVPIASGVPLTINAPQNLTLYQGSASGVAGPCFKGQRLTLIFTQPASGMAAVTFNAIFKLHGAQVSQVANAIVTMSFNFDGTNWIITRGASPGMLWKHSTATMTPSATIATMGTAVTTGPDATALGVVLQGVRLTTLLVGAETLTVQVTPTYSDGTTGSAVTLAGAGAAVAGITSSTTTFVEITGAARLSLVKDNVHITSLAFQVASSIGSSTATVDILAAGLNAG